MLREFEPGELVWVKRDQGMGKSATVVQPLCAGDAYWLRDEAGANLHGRRDQLMTIGEHEAEEVLQALDIC